MRRAIFFGLLAYLALATSILPCCLQDTGDSTGGMTDNPQFLSVKWTGTISVTKPAMGTWGFELSMLHFGTDISGNASMVAGSKTATGNFSGTVSNPIGPGAIKFTLKLPASRGDDIFNMSGAIHVYVFSGAYTSTEIKGSWSNPKAESSGVFALYRD